MFLMICDEPCPVLLLYKIQLNIIIASKIKAAMIDPLNLRAERLVICTSVNCNSLDKGIDNGIRIKGIADTIKALSDLSLETFLPSSTFMNK